MTSVLVLILIPALALLLTAGLTPMVRRAALAGGAVARVRPDRWHTKATPAIGGVAIFLGFGMAVVVGTFLAPETTRALRSVRDGIAPLSHWEALLVAGTLVFALGLIDDLFQLRPLSKLAGQVTAATVLIVSGIGVWLTGIYAVDVGISLFWFVGVTNAMNLLDNMDGLAPGVGAIAGGVLAALFLMDGHPGLASLALALSGALVGFLAHNYPPARIFMGDSGSLFLGIFLAGLGLAPAPGLSRSLFAVMAVPVLILSVPILDTTFVTVQRLLEGRSVSSGGRDHTSHGLVALGITEERAVWILWSLALAGGGVGLMLRTAERALAGVLGGVLLVGLSLVGTYLMSARFRRDGGGAGAEDEEAADALYRKVLDFHERLPVLAFAMDVILICLAYYAAYVIRWDPAELDAELAYFQSSLPVVLAAKLVVFAWVGIYRARWEHFGMEDALRTVRANFFGIILVAAALLLLQRVGLSRGVLIIDFFLCAVLTTGARFSFRLMKGVSRRLSARGQAAVAVGPPEDADLVLRELDRSDGSALRVVAVADPDYGPARGRFRGVPVFGGGSALAHAVAETGAHAVVVVDRGGESHGLPEIVERHLTERGSLDVFVLRVDLRRLEGGRSAVPGSRSHPTDEVTPERERS